MTNLVHLIYVSSATRGVGEDDVLAILRISRARNAGVGVTGMLLYASDSFIQVLEGPRGAVEEVFASIERDRRHRGVKVLVREPIAVRGFPQWSMGFERVRGEARGAQDTFLLSESTLHDRLATCAPEVQSFMRTFTEMTAC